MQNSVSDYLLEAETRLGKYAMVAFFGAHSQPIPQKMGEKVVFHTALNGVTVLMSRDAVGIGKHLGSSFSAAARGQLDLRGGV